MSSGETQKDIYKEPIMYFVVVECKIVDCEKTFIHTIPITMNCCDYPDGTDINADTTEFEKTDTIVGIIPAPVGAFQVSGVVDDSGSIEVIGYEYPGTEKKDWTEVLNEAKQWRRRGI